MYGWVGIFPAGGIYTIARTANGGQSWEYQNDFGVSQIYSICFLITAIGWAVGFDGVILIYSGS